MSILVTGTAGFVGFHTVKKLAAEGYDIIGLDNINSYYNVQLKMDRLKDSGIVLPEGDLTIGDIFTSETIPGYRFVYGDLTDKAFMMRLFEREQIDYVINLAAQAGVRYSLVNPDSYIQSNIQGFFNILECCRKYPVKHLMYASSSSVYGNSTKTPFTETDPTDEAVSLYAATKKSNELMAHTYSHLFRIPSTGLRFFTVYGPWGRPDMAYYDFSKSMMLGKPIALFNSGDMYRDFTYVDDIVESLSRLVTKPPDNAPELTPYRVLNLGNSSPVFIKDFITILEAEIGAKAIVENKPAQITDVYITYADTTKLEGITGFSPATDIRKGISSFAAWFKQYHAGKEF